MHRFFSKTNKTPKKRFFHLEEGTAEDALAGAAGQDKSGTGAFQPTGVNLLSYRQYRFLRSKESLDDILERLMRFAENDPGARAHYFEKILHLLKQYPDLINRAPNKFHSNPLELAITLHDFRMISELLSLNATVRPENMSLLKKIEPFLKNHFLSRTQKQFSFSATIS